LLLLEVFKNKQFKLHWFTVKVSVSIIIIRLMLMITFERKKVMDFYNLDGGLTIKLTLGAKFYILLGTAGKS